MTPAEFKAIRRALGYSQEGVAELMGVASGRTLRRWEAGDRNIPGPVVKLMLLLDSGVLTPDDLDL